MAISPPPEPALATASTRSLAGLSDSDLVFEVRRGCDRAFEQLYERYHRRIAAYIYGMVNDYGRAEDIAQDVFMSALRRMRDTDREIAFKPWVYEIAKNACIDQFRRSRRSEEVSYDAEEGLGAADYGRLVTTGPTPDVAVDQKMAIDHLRGAFGGLSETHHQILVMRELEGLSYREIGERLGMSRPSVESTLFRARRRLGEEYEELVSGERCVRIQAIIGSAAAALPGARDQRRMAAHLSHCQPCRRHANVAGLDASLLVAPRSSRAKIAAFLPLPAFLRRRWVGEEVAPVAANHHVSTLAQFSAQVGTVDPSVYSWGKAAFAAATLAVAGVAGGVAVDDETRSTPGTASSTPRASADAPPVITTVGRAATPAVQKRTPTRIAVTPPARAAGSVGKAKPALSTRPLPSGPTSVLPSAPTHSTSTTTAPVTPVPAAKDVDLAKTLDPKNYPAPSSTTPAAPDPVVAPAVESAGKAVDAAAGQVGAGLTRDNLDAAAKQAAADLQQALGG